ncbi:uncharacterized protein LOC124316381 [Daphnia pulicaria]|uniref:uncharacterized protein LOC124316381 n=1 Tax=Daphnia pulicaria TaxID=35523 RepID=UPI001EEAA4B5|nr:uncharacterized protein LOC124316381 [Daphnia pulicaria]
MIMQRAHKIQGITRGFRSLFLLLLALPVILMCCIIYYTYSRPNSGKLDLELNNIVNLIKEECQQKCDQRKISSSLSNDLPPEKYNLMEETFGTNWVSSPPDTYLSSFDCTIEQANILQLQQDHPCVIRLIRNNYLRLPAPNSLPYQLDNPAVIDPSDGQSKDILGILANQTSGFFIECGGYDGEYLSNTLYMERSLSWSGLLIEADKKSYSLLLSRNRKAYSLPTCISTKPYPTQVTFNGTVGVGGSVIEQIDAATSDNSVDGVYAVQCFPLYSILLAVGRTHVDYFSLDVEGSEYKMLKTIPWSKVNIKTLTVEWNHIPEGEPELTRLMEHNKFRKSHMISQYFSRDVVYVQDSFNIYREVTD